MIIGIVVVVLVILYVIFVYNGLVRARNRVKTNWSQIDVVLKRRADLIPNLVETVKGYAKHENSTLTAVIQARNTYMSASLPESQMAAAGELTHALNKLLSLTEAYPELKADESFLKLQEDLKECENKITYARQFYNDSVYSYMNRIEMFPSCIVARLFNFKPFSLYETDDASREVPKVQF